MTLIEHATLYFQAFSSKNEAGLYRMLHPKVTLRDWTIDIAGRDEVLAEMGRAFRTFNTIAVAPVNLYQHNDTVIGELSISLENELIRVVDIITYTDEREIISIRAFKG
jgi:hypothetical protein